MSKTNKLNSILNCPACHSKSLQLNESEVICLKCSSTYPVVEGIPFLVKCNSPIREQFLRDFNTSDKKLKNKTNFIHQIKHNINKSLKKPEDRLWSKISEKIITDLLEKINPDKPEHIVINVGAGFEKIFNKAFSNYSDLLRIGLPHKGKVDVYGDAMDFPIADSSIDLLFSSSVIEHLENPEIAVREIYRVLKPHGIVYAEIPFLRAYHMVPIDYQRYTISGIESLFARQGFEIVNKGISSGPFTALALFIQDSSSPIIYRIFSNRVVRKLLTIITSWLLHPIKYLDRFVECYNLSTYFACNFFYVGQKQ